jgi:hypothetical protein
MGDPMKSANITLTHEEIDYLIGCTISHNPILLAEMGYKEPSGDLLGKLQAARRRANPLIQEETEA